jgi:hypothetical protein
VTPWSAQRDGDRSLTQFALLGLRASLLGCPERFVVRSKAGDVVATGAFGDSLQLPEGSYRFEAALGGEAFATSLWINTDAATSVVFDGTRALAVRASRTRAR